MEEENFFCKKVTKAEYKPWLNLVRKLWPSFSSQDYKKIFKDIQDSPRQISFLCWTPEGKAIGFANISLRVDYVEGSNSSPVGYLEGVYVEEEYRKKGIARSLIAQAEKWAKKKGAKEIGSDTELHNTLSQKFHTAIGFKKAETIVHFIKPLRS